jgi:1-aminocyclopropane-1-carboxylate deaminase
LIHPYLSGNKYRKLAGHLPAFRKSGKTSILSFGGAYSNHLFALAGLGKLFNIPTIGLVRGERPGVLNGTLKFCLECEMELQFISRAEYRKKREASFLKELAGQYPNSYYIPEGGTSVECLLGFKAFFQELKDQKFDWITTPVGTGGTIAGLYNWAPEETKILGFSVLKNYQDHEGEIKSLLREANETGLINWEKIKIERRFHFSGYAKKNPELENFVRDFKVNQGIPLEPVYSGKYFYGLLQLIKEAYFPVDSNILAVHTGGLRPTPYA